MTRQYETASEPVIVFSMDLESLASVMQAALLFYITGGVIERLGYAWNRIVHATEDVEERLPRGDCPSVCVQLPMYNERAVARRSISAACRLQWPREQLEVQVLDDSTDADTRAIVDACVAEWCASGVRCSVLHRESRLGYKAGALEAGRKQTSAEFLAIFDADFVPDPDFLYRAIPHFYRADGRPIEDLALVQARQSLHAWPALLQPPFCCMSV